MEQGAGQHKPSIHKVVRYIDKGQTTHMKLKVDVVTQPFLVLTAPNNFSPIEGPLPRKEWLGLISQPLTLLQCSGQCWETFYLVASLNKVVIT